MVFPRLFPEFLLDYYPGLLPEVFPGCAKVFLDISVGIPSEVSLRALPGSSLKVFPRVTPVVRFEFSPMATFLEVFSRDSTKVFPITNRNLSQNSSEKIPECVCDFLIKNFCG